MSSTSPPPSRSSRLPSFTSVIDPHTASHLPYWLNSDLPHHPAYANNNDTTLTDCTIQHFMQCYDVDIEHGFLTSDEPLKRMSDARFEQWEQLMDELSSRCQAHNLRHAIENMPELDVTILCDKQNLRRAMLILSMLAHAYVWGESPPAKKLPANLCRPWLIVAHRTGRVPVLTESSIVLDNWRRLDKDNPSIRIGNIAMLNGFLNGIDECHFYMVTVEIEDTGAKALKHMLRAQWAIVHDNMSTVIECLQHVARVLKQLLPILCSMAHRCDPYIFYTRVRPFLAGWKGTSSLPDGVVYEGVSNEQPQMLHGGSAAQSSLIAAFDIFLRIQHQHQHTHDYMTEMRYYMPGSHRLFLEQLEQGPDIRAYIMKKCCLDDEEIKKMTMNYNSLSVVDSVGNRHSRQHSRYHSRTNSINTTTHPHLTTDQLALLTAYNICIDELVAFRSKHIQIVALYILAQAHAKGSKMGAKSVLSTEGIPDGESATLNGHQVGELKTSKPRSKRQTGHHTPTTPPSLNHSMNGTIIPPNDQVEVKSTTTTNTTKCQPSLSQSRQPQVSLSLLKQDHDIHNITQSTVMELACAAAEERGTGGTSIMPFLKTARDETKDKRL